jgi:hypothetical protein
LLLSCLDALPFQVTYRINRSISFIAQLLKHQANIKSNQKHPSQQIKNDTLVSLLPSHYESSVGGIFHSPKPLWMQFFLKECHKTPISKHPSPLGILSKKTAKIPAHPFD